MNEGLIRLIADYQAAVREAVELMKESGIPLPKTNDEWVFATIPHRGMLRGDIGYFKHGYGCSVDLARGPVDFDFGAQGEIDGFDAMRLAHFAGARLPTYGFNSSVALRSSFEAEVAAGSLRYSGYILHYLAHAA